MSEDKEKNIENKKETKTSKPVRPKRPPLVSKGPLAVREDLKDPNYVYRWVNDKDWNMSEKLAADYEFVEDPNDEMRIKDTSMESTKVGSKVFKAVGNKITGYLMRKRREWFDDDQREKARLNKERVLSAPTERGIFNETMEIKRPEKVDDYN